MEIKTVTYSALANLGNYENERLELSAEIGEGETLEQVVDSLKDQVHRNLFKEDALQRRRELAYEIEELEEKITKARASWEKTADFLRAQGLRPDAPAFPIPGMKQLTTEHVEAEVMP